MEKKLSKEERIKEKERLSTVISNKMMVVFVALVVAIMALVYLGGRYVPSVKVMTAAQIVAGVLTVLALVWYAISAKSAKDLKYKIITPALLLGLAASVLFITLMYPTMGASRTILSVIALAVLFFVYEIYPVDFFICSAAVISGCISAAIVDSHGLTLFKKCVVLIVYALVMALCAVIFTKLVKNGKFKIGEKTVKKPFGMSTVAVCIGFAVSLISVIGTLALGGYLIYLVAVACVTYFVIAIIYTVKLM